jgi:hypothetical protein
MFEDEEDELSEAIEPATQWCLILAFILGGFWGVFFLARESGEYDFARQLLWVNYALTPFLAGLSMISGIIALRRLRKKGFTRRGLAVIGMAIAITALLAWLFFTIYVFVLR